MSSKKKSARSDWSSCQSCKLLITNKDWSQHVADCRINKRSADSVDGSFLNESIESRSTDTGQRTYGYIQDNVLHAIVCLPAEKGKQLAGQ